VVQQDHRFGAVVGLRLPFVRAATGQIEAGHHVGHHDGPVAPQVMHLRVAVCGIGECQHGIGVAVQHRPVRQQRMQDRFHRRVRGAGVEQVDPQLVHHLGVAQLRQLRQAPDGLQAQRRETGRFDGCEIPAAALDPQRRHRFAPGVGAAALDGRVAAAVQHQRRIGAHQARSVGDLAEVAQLRPARRLVGIPAIQHRPAPDPAGSTSANAWAMDSPYGGRSTPASVMIAVIRRAGVTSNAGLTAFASSGVRRCPPA